MKNNRIAILDISGRIPVYDDYFCEALAGKANVILYSPNAHVGVKRENYNYYKLVGGDNSISRYSLYLKALLGIYNYLFFGVILLFKRYKIIHIQWFPFLEKVSLEIYVLKFYRFLSPRTSIIYTHHNVFPHNYEEHKKELYRNRMIRIFKQVDHIVVHTSSTKELVSSIFCVPKEKISIVHHGTFVPSFFPQRKRNDLKLRFLMFGNQTYYKGTDLLVEAFSHLNSDDLNKSEVRIIGNTDDVMFRSIKPKAESLGIQWLPKFIDDKTLYQEITDADVLVFPYRAISQSGALLLALPFCKPIILSDLPSFLETMVDFPKYAFFDTGSAESLKNVMEYYINKRSCLNAEILILKSLNDMYSWDNSAKKMMRIYQSIL